MIGGEINGHKVNSPSRADFLGTINNIFASFIFSKHCDGSYTWSFIMDEND